MGSPSLRPTSAHVIWLTKVQLAYRPEPVSQMLNFGVPASTEIATHSDGCATA